jgi:hypothetical protein
MGGGLLNLASTHGTGDDILSINPQITFFKKVYKRHTNFGLETIQISNSTNSNVNFNENVTFTISNTGTLINDMHIEFTLPPAINHYGLDNNNKRVYKGTISRTNCVDGFDSTTVVQLDSAASSVDDEYVGKKIVIYNKNHTSIQNDQAMKTITAYNGTTKKVTLDGAIADLTGATASDYGFDIFDDLESTEGIFGSSNANTWNKYCMYVNAVGFAILDEVKLEIDSKIIDKHNGLWYDIWNELTDYSRKEWSLVGKKNDDEKIVQNLKSRYYVPLKFYFNRNPGLSFPIFLLDNNKIKVNITLNAMEKLIKFDKTTNGDFNSSASITDFKLFTTYVFLDKPEQQRIIKNLPNEYLIETITIKENLSENDLTQISLNNPTKELIWVIRHNDRLDASSGGSTGTPALVNKLKKGINKNPNDIFNYSLHQENTNLGYGSYDTFKTLKIVISNQDRIQTTDATFFRTIQPYKYHSNVPGGINNNEKKKYIYIYSFALKPEEYQPSGSYNFSKTDDTLKLSFNGIGNPTSDTNDLTNYRIDLFAFHYKYLSVYEGGIIYKDVPFSTDVHNKSQEDCENLKVVNDTISNNMDTQECDGDIPPQDNPKSFQIVQIKKWSGLQGKIKKKII